MRQRDFLCGYCCGVVLLLAGCSASNAENGGQPFASCAAACVACASSAEANSCTSTCSASASLTACITSKSTCAGVAQCGAATTPPPPQWPTCTAYCTQCTSGADAFFVCRDACQQSTVAMQTCLLAGPDCPSAARCAGGGMGTCGTLATSWALYDPTPGTPGCPQLQAGERTVSVAQTGCALTVNARGESHTCTLGANNQCSGSLALEGDTGSFTFDFATACSATLTFRYGNLVCSYDARTGNCEAP